MREDLSAAARRARRGRALAAIAVVAAIGLVVAACGSVGPPPKMYVLGEPSAPGETAVPLLARPVIEVKRALVPDYLDGTDIVIRSSANLAEASRSGRWRERLSAGVTRALAGELSRRLPDAVIATSPPPEPAACQLLLDVQAFEAGANGQVAFLAQWRVLAASHATLAGERVSLSEPVAGTGDEPVVAAMSRVVDRLAERVATGIRGLGPACTGPTGSVAHSAR